MMLVNGKEQPQLLTPSEVAKIFRVDPKTVSRWAKAGLIHSIRTPGGHHRFYLHEIRAFFNRSADHG